MLSVVVVGLVGAKVPDPCFDRGVSKTSDRQPDPPTMCHNPTIHSPTILLPSWPPFRHPRTPPPHPLGK